MIYTITFNPALDYIVKMDKFNLGLVNRSEKEFVYAGGKGINVSIVLNNMGIDNRALGFIAGFTGDEIDRQVKEKGCKTDFIRLKNGMSRINVKIKAEDESEINGGGPDISEEALNELYSKLDTLTKDDILVLAGSIPKSIPSDIYGRIMAKLEAKGVKFVVDTTGNSLLEVLKYKPFLVKPNHHELAEMFNVELKNTDEIIEYAKKLKDMGAQNVVISMAGDGAILIKDNGDVRVSNVPKGTVKNSVGAGDSLVAGFITGYVTTNDIEEAFKRGVATGSASAFSEELATKEYVEELLKEVKYI
mgnify:CR=1 FL=1